MYEYQPILEEQIDSEKIFLEMVKAVVISSKYNGDISSTIHRAELLTGAVIEKIKETR